MKKVLGCFDHAFVISLPDQIERLAETRRELARHDIPFEPLRGVEIRSYFSDKKNGDMGCLAAHLQAVKEARRRGYENVLIIEDDIVLRPDFGELWTDVLPQMKGLSYDMFYFYNWLKPTALVRPIRVHPIDSTLCTHFYAVHCSFYDRYVVMVETQLATKVYKVLDWLFHAPEVKVMATSYNLAGQRRAWSKITRDFRDRDSFGYPP
jgi:hypothetical protein